MAVWLHICLASKTRTRLVALFANGKAYRRAIGERLIALLLISTNPALRRFVQEIDDWLSSAILIDLNFSIYAKSPMHSSGRRITTDMPTFYEQVTAVKVWSLFFPS
jgi:hypothetical protein